MIKSFEDLDTIEKWFKYLQLKKKEKDVVKKLFDCPKNAFGFLDICDFAIIKDKTFNIRWNGTILYNVPMIYTGGYYYEKAVNEWLHLVTLNVAISDTIK